MGKVRHIATPSRYVTEYVSGPARVCLGCLGGGVSYMSAHEAMRMRMQCTACGHTPVVTGLTSGLEVGPSPRTSPGLFRLFGRGGEFLPLLGARGPL